MKIAINEINEKYIKEINLKNFIIFILTYLIIFILLGFNYYTQYFLWHEGNIVHRDILASRFFSISSSSYKSSFVGVGQDTLKVKEKNFEEFLNVIDSYFSSHPIDSKNKEEIKLIVEELLLSAYNRTKNARTLREILQLFHDDLKLVENLTPQEKDEVWRIVNMLSKKFYPQAEENLSSTTPSLFFEKGKVIKPGELIIKKGTKLTKKDIKILRKLKIKKEYASFANFLTLFGISFLVYFLFILYLSFWGKNILLNFKKTLLLFTFLILSVLLGVFVLPSSFYYLFPISFFSIIVTISSNANIGISFVFTVVLLLSLLMGEYLFKYLFLMILPGIISAYLMRQPKGRSIFTQTGVVIGVLNFLLFLFLDIYKFDFSIFTLRNALLSLFVGFFSPIIVLGILPIIEEIFGIATSIKLLELSDPEHPLLKKLLKEAPGTYQHSAIVSNLAVAAASNIEADPLLVRAGGFYHDIGKLKRPHFFIENQISEKNIHDEIQPTLSTLAIISHVKDGVELAKKYNLPEEIVDIIRQHHGTSLVYYFYSRAIESPSDKNDLTEEDFRYPGPKPQTKEAAIIMLADTIEAASRTLSNPTPTKIKNLIRSVVNKITEDGQLEESPLTFRDIKIIEDTFEKFLLSLFHSRIEYPKIKLKEVRNGN